MPSAANAPRYIVHGTDQKSGQPTRKIIEAESAAQAADMASKLGMSVQGVEVDPTSVPMSGAMGVDPLGGPAPRASQVGRGKPESTVWHDTPSQIENLWWFVSCVLIVTIPIALWQWLVVRCTKLTLTTERFRIESGVLNKAVEEVELYRVKDTVLKQSLWQRIFGLGTIDLLTSDESMPMIEIRSIRGPREVREQIRQQVEIVRRLRGVRELDVAETFPGNGIGR